VKVLVLGLGNDLLADDGIGLQVARNVRERLAGERDITVRDSSEMGLALLDEIAGVEALVLVDSIQTGRAPPGHVHELCAGDLGGLRANSPHLLGIGDTLALGRLLGLPMPGCIRILGIEVSDTTTFGAELTPAVAAALQPAADRAAAAARAFAAARAGGGGGAAGE
jgi:hydrogenase maturation protease